MITAILTAIPKTMLIPACGKCGQALEFVDPNTMACGYCDLGGKDHETPARPYKSWNCHTFQDAKIELKSEHGNYCRVCGKDLTGWRC